MFRGLARLLDGVESSLVFGYNDAATQHNIRWIQRLDGRPETGILDQDSWNTISRLYTMFVTYGQA